MEENVYFKEEKKNGEGKVRKCPFVKERKRCQGKRKKIFVEGILFTS